MTRHEFPLHRYKLGIVLYVLLSLWTPSIVFGAAAESLDELHSRC